MSGGRSGAFSPRVALALVLAGGLAFIALLWTIGSGMGSGQPEPSGAHSGGKGLVGYAALSDYLKARGFDVEQTRSRSLHRSGGLLVLTPDTSAKVSDIARAVDDHRPYGPTLLIMPKWAALPLDKMSALPNPQAKPGFVALLQPGVPNWQGFHDEIAVKLAPLGEAPGGTGWRGMNQQGTMPEPRAVISARAANLVPLVVAGGDMRTLAGYLDDGRYPGLQGYALAPPRSAQRSEADADAAPEEDAQNAYPLILVFDADLLNNYGMAHPQNAAMAEALVRAATRGGAGAVVFDLTLAGYGRSQNLLELAFTPPFLAATLCLLLAAAAALWRAYHRFGPPLLAARSIAYGKRTLIGNAAGLLRRAKRLHLVGAPYADAARERLVKALALPPRLDAAAAEAAIDRALQARTGAAYEFSAASAALRAARGPRQMLRAAQALNSLERTLLQ